MLRDLKLQREKLLGNHYLQRFIRSLTKSSLCVVTLVALSYKLLITPVQDGKVVAMYCICSANCHRIDKPYIAWTLHLSVIKLNPTSLLPYYPFWLHLAAM